MESENVQLVFFFEQKTLEVPDIIDYFEKIHFDLYDSGFQEISYSIPKGILSKTKSLKFNAKNIQRVTNENTQKSFDISSLLDDWQYKSTDLKCLVSYDYLFQDNISSLLISLNRSANLKKFNSYNWVNLYMGVVKYLVKYQIKLKYGFIFSMKREKFPTLLIHGIGHFYSSKEEKNDLQVWNEKKSEIDFKIWRVFWGNLITHRHLKPGATIDRIEETVGKDNFYTINDNLFFFNLPSEELVYDTKSEGITSKLAGLLTMMSS